MNLTDREKTLLFQSLLEELGDHVRAVRIQFSGLRINDLRTALADAELRVLRLKELATEISSL